MAITGAVVLLLGACGSPTEPVSCQTRWSEVEWSPLGLDGFTVTGIAETPWGLFAATDTQGVYRLDDGTETWESRGLDGATLQALAYVDGAGRLLAGGRATVESWSPPDRTILSTEDGGASWTPSDAGYTATGGSDVVRELVVDTADPDRVFLASYAGVQRSTDGGARWELILEVGARGIGVLPGTDVLLVAFSSDIGPGGMRRSTNAGGSWEAVELPGDWYVPNAFAVDPRTASRIWMGGYGWISRSDDRGATWAEVVELGHGSMVGLTAPDNAVVTMLDRVVEEDVQLFFSCDAGDSWTESPTPSEIRGAATLTAARDGTILVGTTEMGVWRIAPVGR